jgi:ribose 5-phosphate isomerase B
MKIVIASDHGGFELKQMLIERLQHWGHSVEDLGCHAKDSVDYPPYAEAVCRKIIAESCEAGILICGTGIGMSIVANRNRRIRAALCHDGYTARLSREHNNANILCLGARVVGPGVAEEIVKTWLTTDFAGGRHQLRVRQFSD